MNSKNKVFKVATLILAIFLVVIAAVCSKSLVFAETSEFSDNSGMATDISDADSQNGAESTGEVYSYYDFLPRDVMPILGFVAMPNENGYTMNGYTNPSFITRTHFQTYKDESLPSLYARSIAHFKNTEIQKALKEVENLIKKQPDNPYFWELKGQILFETGKINQSIDAYKKAVELEPKAVLIRLSLAHALIEQGSDNDIKQAVEHLEYITTRDNYLPDAWRFLNIAYARQGEKGLADYAAVENAFISGKYKEALSLIPKAKKELKNNSVKTLRLSDMEEDIKRNRLKS